MKFWQAISKFTRKFTSKLTKKKDENPFLEHFLKNHRENVAKVAVLHQSSQDKEKVLEKYKDKLHKVEVALLLGVCFTVLFSSWLQKEQAELAEGLIRLHVVANSDSEADQSLKLRVRDEILAVAESFYEKGMTTEEAEHFFLEHLSLVAEAGERVAEGYPVTAELRDMWFPTKEYDSFALPAGGYSALHITIGEGGGENWWCVAYPPLCLGAVSETVDWAVEAGNFTQAQGDFITGEGYVLKFKAMELLENWKHFTMTNKFW